MKPIIKIDLKPTNYAGAINLANRIVASMTGNGNFATPAVPLATITTASDAVADALAIWAPLGGRGSKADLLDLREKNAFLRELIISEAQYVALTAQLAAPGDNTLMASIIGTSGFELKKVPGPQGVLEMVQGFHRFVSRQLAVNQVKLKWKKPLNLNSPRNVDAYKVMRASTTDFATAVEIAETTRTSYVDDNNTVNPQKWTYWIVPFNSAGPGVPSDGLTATVLNA